MVYSVTESCDGDVILHTFGGVKGQLAPRPFTTVVIGIEQLKIGQRRSGVNTDRGVEVASICRNRYSSRGGRGPGPPKRIARRLFCMSGLLRFARGSNACACYRDISAADRSAVDEIV